LTILAKNANAIEAMQRTAATVFIENVERVRPLDVPGFMWSPTGKPVAPD